MTTTQDLIFAARRHLDAGQLQELNQLKAGIDSAAQTVTCTYPIDSVQPGTTIAVDLEVMYVWAVNRPGQSLTVQRGFNGSTPAAHGAGGLLRVNPRWSDYELFCALNDDLRDLSAPGNLFQVKTLNLAPVPWLWSYDLTGAEDILDVQEIRWRMPDNITEHWVEVSDYELMYDMPTTDFPSGIALVLPEGGIPVNSTIRLRYRAPLGQLAALGDDVAATGLPASATDLPPLGAAIRVLAGRPVRRNNLDVQGETRRAAEVSTADLLNQAGALRQLRQVRLSEEANRLYAQWPLQRKRPRL